MRDQRERGFTLIEMMIVVAVIAILAAVAIPAFFSQSRKAKAASETSAMFAELSTKEEQYKVESGTYLSAATCPATLTGATPQSLSTCTAGAPWTALHINPPETKAACQYTITAGLKAVTPTMPTPPGTFHMLSDGSTFPTPIASWYFILAQCDADGNGTPYSYYFMSSADTKIQTSGEGN